MAPPAEKPVTSAAEAMATTFQVHIVGWDESSARQAAMEAFAELHRIERLLSRFVEGSDIDRLNKAPAGEPVRVRSDTIACLAAALRIEEVTNAAFNIAAGTSVTGQTPAPTARGSIELDHQNLIIERTGPPVQLDLGGIGKGFAVDLMIERLREWEVPAALVDAGGSTAFGFSGGSDSRPWSAAMEAGNRRASLTLDEFGFAASGTSVKGQHIFDGRTGRIARGPTRTWARAPTAAVADALSTATLVMPAGQIEELCVRHSEFGIAWASVAGGGRTEIHALGLLSSLHWETRPE